MNRFLKKSYWLPLAAGLLLLPALLWAQTITPQQAEFLKRLTPAQQNVVREELAKSGGNLTPQAIAALKSRPELQGLSLDQLSPGDAPQMESFKRLTPAQQNVVREELAKSGGNLTPQAITALKSRPELQGLSLDQLFPGEAPQMESFKRLTPAQQNVVREELAKSGGNLTPQAIAALKSRPELQGLSLDQLFQGDASQAESFRRLTPAQQNVVNEELAKTGGILTPQAIAALKSRPEFLGLSPEEIVRGKELLDRQEILRKEAEKVRLMSPGIEAALEREKGEPERRVIVEDVRPSSLYDRSREVRKYQDIALDLKPFGYEFFRDAAVRVITDRKDLPVPMKYVVGPGDEVRIALWGRINASYNLTIDRDGKITIPSIGPLSVAGMTFDEMSQYLIKQAEQITGTNVDVTMGALRTIPVFILGDVRRPGAYTIGSFATITDALLLAGGPSEIGTMRNIQLRRRDKVIQTFDLYNLLLKGDKSRDMVLQAGDIVFVPVIGPYVGVAGNVRRPALYEMKDDFSLAHLFDLAGGIVPTAFTQQIQVERIVKNEKQIVIDIDDKHLDQGKTIRLQDTDLVKVFSIVDRNANVVTLSGNVKRGGKYALKPGMRLGDILKDPLQDLLPETHFDYALIKRQNPPKMEPLLIPFNLGDLLIRRDPSANHELHPLDSIHIFSKWFFRDKPLFTISGEVRMPGRFDLASNMRIRDAILTAGDLTKNAYLRKGELIRVSGNREYRTLYFDVAAAIEGDPQENIPLEDEDRLIIHSLYEEQWREFAAVSGEVKNPGQFILTEKMRVSDLIFKAGGQTRDTLLDQAEIYRTDWKTKEVTLKRIDLGKALAGDPAHNLALKDLDRLIVHSIWETVYQKNVTVEGDVLKPGNYPLAANMTVRDLVFAAGNLLESAAREQAEVSFRDIDAGNHAVVLHRKIDLGKALAGDPEHNLLLKPHSRLFIKRIPDWAEVNYATLSGEVKFPGRYVIKKGERLSAVIERAGGYTKEAYLRGAFFTRERVRTLQQQSIAEMADRMERDLLAAGAGTVATALSSEEVLAKKAELEQRQKFIQTLRQLKATGRMTIYLAHLRLLKGSEYDIELEGGDTLLIPEKNSVVNVVGAVMTQGSYIHSDRMAYQDYIRETGGYSRYADRDNVFVMKVDGSARKLVRGMLDWSDQRQRWEVAGFGEPVSAIEPGDTIVVPEKMERIAWLREIRDITQILMNTAVTAGIVIKLW
jgi:protein involved in polysaccharide export with SLBB domain